MSSRAVMHHRLSRSCQFTHALAPHPTTHTPPQHHLPARVVRLLLAFPASGNEPRTLYPRTPVTSTCSVCTYVTGICSARHPGCPGSAPAARRTISPPTGIQQSSSQSSQGHRWLSDGDLNAHSTSRQFLGARRLRGHRRISTGRRPAQDARRTFRRARSGQCLAQAAKKRRRPCPGRVRADCQRIPGDRRVVSHNVS
jgi:hypothetical protein